MPGTRAARSHWHNMGDMRIGTEGWALPRDVRDRFGEGASNLARYATCLNAVEVNSSFHRPHRRSTYARWADSVPAGFRFAVKLPRAISHLAALTGCDDALGRFADEVQGLGDKLGPILVQLPPKAAFDPDRTRHFFQRAVHLFPSLVCEPRHISWFSNEADRVLAELRVARVAADPPPAPGAADPGGWRGLTYFRLHGSPSIYRSSYGDRMANYADRVNAVGEQVWVIFDNTASGAATSDALAFRHLV